MTVDCMSCLVAISRGRWSDGMSQEAGGGITHATSSHGCIRGWRTVLCDGFPTARIQLVQK